MSNNLACRRCHQIPRAGPLSRCSGCGRYVGQCCIRLRTETEQLCLVCAVLPRHAGRLLKAVGRRMVLSHG
jgi:hypothetical protein